MTHLGYVLGGYLLTAAVLGGYVLRLRSRGRALARVTGHPVDGPAVTPAPPTRGVDRAG